MRYLKFCACILLAICIFCAGCFFKTDKQEPNVKKALPGGQLIYGSLQEPDSLNPLLSDLIATAEVSSLIYSGLVTTDDKGGMVPDLATEVPSYQNGGVSPDGLTVTYKLRPGVAWHDGAPFSSADVKFTWEVIMNRKVNIVSREGYDLISSIDTPDPNTVVIRFKQYYAPYLTLFPVILPKHILENAEDLNKAPFNRSPVGTGPFKFKEWRIAEAIILDANPNYYKGKPNLDSIIYKIIPDADIMLSQLKNGDLDMVSNINFNLLDQIRGINGIAAVITPNMIWEHLDFNLDNTIFQDVKVRTAIAMAIDRQVIISDILKGAASPAAADQTPGSWVYNNSLKPPARDINGAKNLLVQAGWKQGTDGIFIKDGKRLSFNLAINTGNKLREAVAQILVSQLKEAGIEVVAQPVDTNVFFSDMLRNRRFETAMYAWVTGSDPDDRVYWHSKSIPGANNGYTGLNYPGWRNQEIDRLCDQGAGSVDLELRKQAYFRIQQIIATEFPVIPLYFHANIDAVKNTVVNFKPNPSPSGNLWNAWEWGLTSKR